MKIEGHYRARHLFQSWIRSIHALILFLDAPISYIILPSKQKFIMQFKYSQLGQAEYFPLYLIK